jgi:predicted RNA-binding protein with PUA-like domain
MTHGVTHWDDVRNFQAQKNLKAMRLGDTAFFYHTGNERQIMGTVEVVREAYPDPSDPAHRFIMVDMKTLTPFSHPVTLARVKAEPLLAHLPLVTQGRLSVMPIDLESWFLIMGWGKGL